MLSQGGYYLILLHFSNPNIFWIAHFNKVKSCYKKSSGENAGAFYNAVDVVLIALL